MKNLRKYFLAGCLFFNLSTPRLEADFSSNVYALAQNLALSGVGFFTLNAALFHQELRHGTTNACTLVLISGIEIGKNLVNYVLIENSAQIPLSIVTWVLLNQYRRSLKINLPQEGKYPEWILDLLVASVEVLKNRINFVITENTFPHEWSKPPQLER